MKNTSIFSAKFFIFFKTSLKKAKQSIHKLISFILIIIYLKLVTKKFLVLLNPM